MLNPDTIRRGIEEAEAELQAIVARGSPNWKPMNLRRGHPPAMAAGITDHAWELADLLTQ